MPDLGELIGVPFVNGGRGPDSFDCYGLIMHLLKEDGIDIPDYISPTGGAKIMAIFNSEIRLWQECKKRHGVILLFKVPGNLHVGYYLGNDTFIHTWEKSGGVTIERLSTWERRLVGIYEYIG